MGVGVYRRPFASAVNRQQRHRTRWTGTSGIPPVPRSMPPARRKNPVHSASRYYRHPYTRAQQLRQLRRGSNVAVKRTAPAPMSTLVDAFATSIDSKWTPDAGISWLAGRVIIPASGVINVEVKMDTVLDAYTIDGSYVFGEFPEHVAGGSNVSDLARVLLDPGNANAHVSIYKQGNSLFLGETFPAGDNISSVAFTLPSMRWWAIVHRLTGGLGTFEYYTSGAITGPPPTDGAVSGNGWAQKQTLARVNPLGYRQKLRLGTVFSTSAGTGQFIVDNINNVPTTTLPIPRRRTGIHPAIRDLSRRPTRAHNLRQLRRGGNVGLLPVAPQSLATLVDDFDTQIDSKWFADAGASWSNGAVAMSPSASIATFVGVSTRFGAYTIDGSSFFGKFPEHAVGGSGGFDELRIQLDPNDIRSYVGFRKDIDAGTLERIEAIGASASTTSAAFDSVANLWWAIVHRLTGGNGTFDWYVSPSPRGTPPTDGSDGTNGWNLLRTRSRTNALSDRQRVYVFQRWTTSQPTGQFVFDNANTLPQSLPPARRRNPINAQARTYRHPYSRAQQLRQLRRGLGYIPTLTPTVTTTSLPPARRKNPLHAASRSYRHQYSRAQQLRQLRHGSFIATLTPTVAPRSLPPPAPQRRLIGGGKTYRKPLPRAYHRYLIRRTRWIGTSGDIVAPIPTVVSVDVTKISRVAGKDIAAVDFTTDEAFVEYEVRVVPNGSSPRGAGSQLETAIVASRTSHSISITDDELVAASGIEGTNVLKVFVKDVAGNWST